MTSLGPAIASAKEFLPGKAQLKNKAHYRFVDRVSLGDESSQQAETADASKCVRTSGLQLTMGYVVKFVAGGRPGDARWCHARLIAVRKMSSWKMCRSLSVARCLICD